MVSLQLTYDIGIKEGKIEEELMFLKALMGQVKEELVVSEGQKYKPPLDLPPTQKQALQV